MDSSVLNVSIPNREPERSGCVALHPDAGGILRGERETRGSLALIAGRCQRRANRTAHKQQPSRDENPGWSCELHSPNLGMKTGSCHRCVSRSWAPKTLCKVALRPEASPRLSAHMLAPRADATIFRPRSYTTPLLRPLRTTRSAYSSRTTLRLCARSSCHSVDDLAMARAPNQPPEEDISVVQGTALDADVGPPRSRRRQRHPRDGRIRSLIPRPCGTFPP